MIQYQPKKILIRNKDGSLSPLLSFKGDKGEKGDAFKYENFTTLQLLTMESHITDTLIKNVEITAIAENGDSESYTFIIPKAVTADTCKMDVTFIDNTLGTFNIIKK